LGLCLRHNYLDERLSCCTVSAKFEVSGSNTHDIAEITIFDIVDRDVTVVLDHEAIRERIVGIQLTGSDGEQVEFVR